MTGPDDTRLAEVHLLVEEALVVVERQRWSFWNFNAMDKMLPMQSGFFSSALRF